MDWKDVGDWLKKNAGAGAALVGSLLTGNAPGAIAAGMSIVASATGQTQPDQALATLQGNPETLIRLKEIAHKEEASIREHIRLMKEAELKDRQAEHHETQETIRSGDNADDVFVRRTRPGQSWVSLVAALVYVWYCTTTPDKTVDTYVLGALLALPWTYAGLREIGKGINVFRKK